jgi:hypothetical protein
MAPVGPTGLMRAARKGQSEQEDILDEFKAFLTEQQTTPMAEIHNGKALMGVASPSCKN